MSFNSEIFCLGLQYHSSGILFKNILKIKSLHWFRTSVFPKYSRCSNSRLWNFYLSFRFHQHGVTHSYSITFFSAYPLISLRVTPKTFCPQGEHNILISLSGNTSIRTFNFNYFEIDRNCLFGENSFPSLHL